MQCICCRCGAPQSGASDTLCLKVPRTEQSYHCHCFCCAQSPRMKCLYCNAWRDLAVWEAHGPCLVGSMHLFVYSEPWPPFPDHTPHPPQQGMVITLDRSQKADNSSEINTEFNTEPPPVEEHVIVESQEEAEEHYEPVDVKPKLMGKAKWVSIGDIRNWTSCIRCGMVKINKVGWIRHAQKCGQDPKFASRKFFIYLHTMSWCGKLVMDTFWDAHSDPEKGNCKICRISRKNMVPLPYQPRAPARKNERALQKQHQSRLNSKRRRKKSMAVEATIRNESLPVNPNNRKPSKDSSLKIIACTSLRQ